MTGLFCYRGYRQSACAGGPERSRERQEDESADHLLAIGTEEASYQ